MDAFRLLCRTEGIIPAIESAHALAGATLRRRAARSRRDPARQPLRARRQGHGHRRRAGSGCVDVTPVVPATAYAAARAEGRAALVGYLPAGFPSYDGCLEAMRALVDAGVDVVEVGLPYSDPVIDGPTIQAATERRCAAAPGSATCCAPSRRSPAMGVATVVMTYWNPVLAYGVDAVRRRPRVGRRIRADHPRPDPGRGARTGSSASDDARPRADLPGRAVVDRRRGSPSTVAACRGWVYAASTMGVTGARAATSSAAPGAGRRGPGRTRAADRGRARRLQRRAGRGGRVVRRRRDRRLGAGAVPARRRHRGGRRRGGRRARGRARRGRPNRARPR